LWNAAGKEATGKPDWDKIKSVIRHKYSRDYAERTVLGAQIRWYEARKDSLAQLKYQVMKIDQYGLDTAGFGKLAINNSAYYLIFRHSKDPVVLNKGIQWMEVLLKAEPNNAYFLDTYANLLYKTGRTDEALKEEDMAAKLDPTQPEIKINYTKMKSGQPTWRNPTEKHGKRVWYSASIGSEPRIADVILERVREAAARAGR